MYNLVDSAKRQIDSLIAEAVVKAARAGLLPAAESLPGAVEIPRESANGDYAATHAMAGARVLKMPPRKIAEAIAQNIELEGTYFSRCEVAGPGFINFFLSDKWFHDVLAAVEAAGEDYGRVDVGHGERVMVEFVSANPTGPMTIGLEIGRAHV